jgi:hypothetical protein
MDLTRLALLNLAAETNNVFNASDKDNYQAIMEGVWKLWQ